MLQLQGISKTYDGVAPALADIDLVVAAGEIVCLLGPSGCGKTTLLRIVAGLERADQGQLLLDGANLADVPVYRRNFGLMFQEYALFPHRTVGENIAFGLRMAAANGRQASDQIAARVNEMLALVNLQGYGGRSVFALSGGERQRVALARSLAPNPRLLMLDEPLGNLDRTLREELMTELRTILKSVGVTALYVTHDQQEAFAVSDRLVVMNRGRIEQEGTPPEVYQQPANEFVARFLGFQNLVAGVVQQDAPTVAQTSLGEFTLPAAVSAGEYTLLIRPRAIHSIAPVDGAIRGLDHFPGRLESLSFRGSYTRAEFSALGATEEIAFVFELSEPLITSELAQRIGELHQIMLRPDGLTLLR
jgi:thiamine transport system ATP-binding protein